MSISIPGGKKVVIFGRPHTYLPSSSLLELVKRRSFHPLDSLSLSLSLSPSPKRLRHLISVSLANEGGIFPKRASERAAAEIERRRGPKWQTS